MLELLLLHGIPWQAPADTLRAPHGRRKRHSPNFLRGWTAANTGSSSNTNTRRAGRPRDRQRCFCVLARPSQFEGLTGAKPFRISEGYPRVFTTEKGGGDLSWGDLGGLGRGRRLRGECDPSLVQVGLHVGLRL